MHFPFNISDVYLAVCIISAVVCLMMGILLMLNRHYEPVDENIPIHPRRYIMARRALGIAYIIMGIMTLTQILFVNIPPVHKREFFPLTGLVIVSSQALLFTCAALALFNSKLVNRFMIWFNILPILLFVVLFFMFQGHEKLQQSVRFLFFVYYFIQVVVYTITFFIERIKFLSKLEEYFDLGKLYDFYKCKGITFLFMISVGIGIWALASFFFLSVLQEIIFKSVYTIFYVIVALYYMSYSKRSQRIHDITTPENWKSTEKYKKHFIRKERVLKNED